MGSLVLSPYSRIKLRDEGGQTGMKTSGSQKNKSQKSKSQKSKSQKSKSQKSKSQKSKSPSELIDARIKELGDWRGKMLSRLRTLVKQADPEVVEEWKWRG